MRGSGDHRGAPALMRIGLSAFFRSQVAIGRGTTPEKAGARIAETILRLTTIPTGLYIDRGKVTPSSRESYDELREEQLWHVAAGWWESRPTESWTSRRWSQWPQSLHRGHIVMRRELISRRRRHH
jgi:hypothetical protein